MSSAETVASSFIIFGINIPGITTYGLKFVFYNGFFIFASHSLFSLYFLPDSRIEQPPPLPLAENRSHWNFSDERSYTLKKTVLWKRNLSNLNRPGSTVTGRSKRKRNNNNYNQHDRDLSAILFGRFFLQAIVCERTIIPSSTHSTLINPIVYYYYYYYFRNTAATIIIFELGMVWLA